MPYRKKILKKSKSVISDNIKAYLLTGERAPGDAETFMLQRGGSQLKAIWKAVNRELLNDWIKQNPCSRPWAWWEWDAPRAEPRQRLGGTGTPDYEVLAYVPHFDHGIPTGWITKFDEAYYNGRALDIHGNPIGTEHKEGDFSGVAIDPTDPPTFESEAAYLQRHGLLTPAEARHLEKYPELLNPERIEPESLDD
jgi:hypothetical protein